MHHAYSKYVCRYNKYSSVFFTVWLIQGTNFLSPFFRVDVQFICPTRFFVKKKSTLNYSAYLRLLDYTWINSCVIRAEMFSSRWRAAVLVKYLWLNPNRTINVHGPKNVNVNVVGGPLGVKSFPIGIAYLCFSPGSSLFGGALLSSSKWSWTNQKLPRFHPAASKAGPITDFLTKQNSHPNILILYTWLNSQPANCPHIKISLSQNSCKEK